MKLNNLLPDKTYDTIRADKDTERQITGLDISAGSIRQNWK
jgi:hypothetical protein